MKKFLIFALLIFCFPFTVKAQFSSGSTGADGALDLSTMNCPNNVCEVQLPESGVLNYTTINVPQGKELRFRFNSRNTPITLLAQGSVNVNGSINISGGLDGFTVTPGPGGFFGGGNNGPGLGPGGGQNGINNNNGRWVGSLSLVPIIGGSGGAFNGNFGGSGGGGALVIASSAFINVTGSILANWASSPSGACCGGSGGAIRLVSNTLTIPGVLSSCGFANSNCGIIRLEAQPGQINFTGTANPIPVFAQINPVIIPINPPTLVIASIGGYAVPSYSAGRPDRVDLMLPIQLTDPLNVVIQGNNVPVGTQVNLQLSGPSGTATNCLLAGTIASSSCTCSLSGASRTGVTTLLAVAVFSPPPFAEAFNPKGKTHVAKVKIESAAGMKPKYVFLGADGTAIDQSKLSPQFLQQFGL